MAFCMKCKKEIGERALECSHCGHEVGRPTSIRVEKTVPFSFRPFAESTIRISAFLFRLASIVSFLSFPVAVYVSIQHPKELPWYACLPVALNGIVCYALSAVMDRSKHVRPK